MNAIKKIGLSALAGSLVAMSAHAAEVTMSGGASVAVTSSAKSNKSTFYQNDSITFTVSGETDGGLTVTTSMELDGDTAGTTAGMDSRSIKVAHPEFGTVTFSGHGGDSVMSAWDDVTPTAYEEVWALTKSSAATPVGNQAIGGFAGDNLWRYDSPSFAGASFHASYQSKEQTGNVGAYSDWGIQIAPEAIEGLSIGYALGTSDESTSGTGIGTDVTGLEESTLWVKYAFGPVSLGYQTSEVDGPTTTQDDDSTAMSISYAISDDLSVSYGIHELDLGSATDAGTDQESTGISASYTMGGTTISAAMNQTDNIAGTAADDEESMEIALVFAF
ncbi:porin [Pelagibacteraceae bacterium]|nr:porin [Pelagibacteraceae bacterium]